MQALPYKEYEYKYFIRRSLINNECCDLLHQPPAVFEIALLPGEELYQIEMQWYTVCERLSDIKLIDLFIAQQLTIQNIAILSNPIQNSIQVGLPPVSQMMFITLNNQTSNVVELPVITKNNQRIQFSQEFIIDPIDAVVPFDVAISTFFKIRRAVFSKGDR